MNLLVLKQYVITFNDVEYLKVEYSDGSSDMFNLIDLGVQWFLMSNDAFADKFGFDFTPQKYNIYDKCKEIAFRSNLSSAT